MYQRFRTTSFGLILTGTISAGLHASAQHLTTNADMGARGSSHLNQIVQSIHVSAVQGHYQAITAGGEPGFLGTVIGLTSFVGLYFVLRRRSASKPTPNIPLPASSGVYANDSL